VKLQITFGRTKERESRETTVNQILCSSIFLRKGQMKFGLTVFYIDELTKKFHTFIYVTIRLIQIPIFSSVLHCCVSKVAQYVAALRIFWNSQIIIWKLRWTNIEIGICMCKLDFNNHIFVNKKFITLSTRQAKPIKCIRCKI